MVNVLTYIYRRGKLEKIINVPKIKLFAVVEKIARCNDSLFIGKYGINHSNYIVFEKYFIYEVNFCFIFFVFSKTYIIWLVEFRFKYINLLFDIPYTLNSLHLKIKNNMVLSDVYYICAEFRRNKILSENKFTFMIWLRNENKLYSLLVILL